MQMFVFLDLCLVCLLSIRCAILLPDGEAMAPTTQLALSHMGSDICDMIDSFRNPVVFRAPIDTHGRAALYKAQHRWVSLSKKREVAMRFDIDLPPYPGLGFLCCIGCVHLTSSFTIPFA